MYEAIKVRIKGIVPLLCHNGQLADPLNQYARAMKEITSKRKKTDDDYAELRRLEWYGGLYLDSDRRPIIPGENLEGLLVSGAKKSRLGESAKAGIIVDDAPVIKHDGPKDLDKLYECGNFIDTRKAGVKGNSVMRTRPIFRAWELEFAISFLPDVLNKSDVIKALEDGLRLCGLGDFTPRYGRGMIC